MTTNGASELPKPGDLVGGRYRVERVIATGGMGIVLEARHLKLDERVAIKLVRPEIATSTDTDVLGRFAREARACIKIRSEHAVRVFDTAELENGAPYIVMEYLDGQDLEQLLAASGPLPIGNAVDYILQACEALAEAHAQGIIHRDLKPANLFLTRRADQSPCVKVTDFGISKIASAGDELSMTTTHQVMGSPLYMSPEQMRSARSADARSDIWSMGVILYELLTATPPFNGTSLPELCTVVLGGAPPSLLGTRPEVPLALERVILRCLEKSPEARYQNVAELAMDLAPFGGGHATLSAPRISAVLRVAMRATSSSAVLVARRDTEDAPKFEGATSTAWGAMPDRPHAVDPLVQRRSVARKAIGAVLALGLVAAMAVLAYAPNRRPAVTGASKALVAAPQHLDADPALPRAVASVVVPDPPIAAIASATASTAAPPNAAPWVASPKKREPMATRPVSAGGGTATASRPPAPPPSASVASVPMWRGRK